jgi:hypothetical protein
MGKLTEPRFFKGRSPNGQKAHEEMLNIPGHKENLQIQTTLIFHLTPVKMITINNINNNKY